MNKATDQQQGSPEFDSWDYCIAFWEGAIDDDEDCRQLAREITGHRHVQSCDETA